MSGGDLKAKVLSAYRNVIKSTRITFKDDHENIISMYEVKSKNIIP